MMKNYFVNVISNIGKRIDGPTFIKEFEDSGTLISELEDLACSIKDAAIQDEIDMDIRFIKAGDQGEKNVCYELKNSFIPMLVLHNVVIQYDDYKAQMDYILITNKFICILETKKLNGNITINADGDFIRSLTNRRGKVYKKEGMYSPISQNQRHVRILENLLLREKVIKKTPVLSLVVIANPKSIINSRYARKEIKQQIMKYDQLTPRLTRMLEDNNEVRLVPKRMIKMADFLLENHVQVENAFIQKYEKYMNTDGTDISTEPYQSPVKEPVSTVAEQVASTVDEKNDNKSTHYDASPNKEIIRKDLVKFRLEQSRAENIKAYIIFNNNQLDALLESMPSTLEEIMQCKGFGPVKVEKYGEQILKILKGEGAPAISC